MRKPGRPALAPGEIRSHVTLSLSKAQAEKLRRISKNRPSAWLRQILDAHQENHKT